MTRNLSEEIHSQIALLCKEGDQLQRLSNFDDALRRYKAAWALLPEPKEDWEAATWVLAAMGDVNWAQRQYSLTVELLSTALLCPNGLGNPFIHLRLGEAFFELRNLALAKDHLTRAYMGAGREIFDQEDPKYLDVLKDTLIPPDGRSQL